MRLIDAEELKRSIAVSALIEDQKTLEQIIDEQPTIEERKKWKWIVIEYPDIYVCPFCKNASSKKNFCGTCGADLRGE